MNEIIPGEEKWDTLKNWDELDHNDKTFVVIERSKPTLLAFSTSVNLADFSPWELNSNFEKLYASTKFCKKSINVTQLIRIIN